MKNKILVGLLLIIGISIVSCKKNETVPPPKYIADNNALFESNRTNATQTFSIDAGIFNEVIGVQGTKIQIPAFSFVSLSGAPISGTIDIDLLEILDQTDMILMNAPTSSNGQILISGGELNVEASQNGNQIYLAPGSQISVQVPNSNPTSEMELFTGLLAGDSLTWDPSLDSSGFADTVLIVTDSSGWGDYYYFDWDDPYLGWINCDYFYGSSSIQTTLTCYLEDEHSFLNTNIFLHFSDINSVLTMYGDYTNPSQQSFVSSGIPEGANITIVAISEISGNYYSAFVPTTVITNHTETLTLSPTTLTDFENDLDNL